MNKKEIIFGGITVIGSYVLFFIMLTVLKLNRISFIALCTMNVALIVYYLKFLSTKNNTKVVDKFIRFIISVDIFYLCCCLLCCVLCCTNKIIPCNILSIYKIFKLILRIGYIILLLTTFTSFIYFLVKRDEKCNPLKIHIRQILIFLSNFIFIPFAIYHYSYSSIGGRFEEQIQDGPESIHTFYVDSLQNYVTQKHVFIDEHGFSNNDYMIYYEAYPNSISKIDTLSKTNH